MRAQGHDPRRLAAELGRSLSAVRFVLGPGPARIDFAGGS
jgi:hypothetical protein